MAFLTSLSPYQTRLLRMRSQRLAGDRGEEPETPDQVLVKVCGVQAQELPAGLLSIRARSKGLTTAEVERARQEERSILWTWAMRGTLHLISAEDTGWLLQLLAPRLIAGGKGRMSQLGWDEANTKAALNLLAKRLREGGLIRAEIAQLFKENGLPWEGQAPFHLIYRAALEGLVCHGPDRDGEPTFVLRESWLPQEQALSREEALALIARRFLAGYAPAAPEDLAQWSGLSLSEAREAWKLNAEALVPVETPGGPAWLLKEQLAWLKDLPEMAGKPTVRLLPRYDTYLLGYQNRELAVEPRFAKRVHPGGGILHPVVLVDGQARGVWKSRRRRLRGREVLELQVEPFEPFEPELIPLLEAEAADIGRFSAIKATLVILS